MASSSNSNGTPVSLSVTNMMGGGPTVLSSAQASQLLQKLRAMNVPGGPQTIKIQAIQTNPVTGVKQIVAIPIQSATGPKASGSPMKIIKIPAPIGEGSKMMNSSSNGMPAGVKLVKLAPSSINSTSSPQTIYRARATQVVSSPSKPVVVSSNQFSNHMATTSNVRTNQQYTTVQNSNPIKYSVTNQATHYSSGSNQINQLIGARSNQMSHSSGGGSSLIVVETGATRGIKRERGDIDFEAFSDAKRKKPNEKGSKGLRHFSMKVCEKVQAKGLTSYNEVADELVSELTDPRCTSPTDQQYDQKNIRRRVYDALNVLMAMNIISKEKKEIRWLGLPTNSVQEANGLEVEKTKRIERIKAKTQQLQDLILQQVAFKNLVERNREREKRDGGPTPNSAIQLPFIIVNTSKKTVIDCSISNDKMEYLFNFDDTFEIHDDMEVLKRMGLSLGLERGQVTADDLNKARSMLPRALDQYVTDLAKNGLGSSAGIPRVSTPKVLKEELVDIGSHVLSDSEDTDVEIN